jgi:hypothetical protein
LLFTLVVLKLEAAKRRNRMDAYNRQELANKIQQKEHKVDQLLDTKDALRKRRQSVRKESAKRRQLIVESFEKLKREKKLEEFGRTFLDSRSGRPQSAGQLRTDDFGVKPSLGTRCSTFEISSKPSVEEVLQQEVTTVSRVHSAPSIRPTQPASAVYTLRQIKPNDDVKGKERPRTAKPRRRRNEAKGTKKKINPVQEVEQLRRRQNEYLMMVLEQEQQAEKNRELKLAKSANSDDRQRLEKEFALARSKASSRICTLTQDHELAISAKLAELNVLR